MFTVIVIVILSCVIMVWKIYGGNHMGYTVLLFEDDATMTQSLLANVSWDRFDVSSHLTANNVPDGLLLFEKHKIDLAICDIEVINGTGMDLLKWVKTHGYETEFILLTNYAEFSYAQEALRLGVIDYIVKTEPIMVLERAIECSVERIRRQRISPLADHATSAMHSERNDFESNYPEEPNISFFEMKETPQWEEWKQYLVNAEKISLLDSLKVFFDMAKRKNKTSPGFLASFQHDFIQMVGQALLANEIQPESMFDFEFSSELYRKSSVSIFDMMKWISYFIDRIIPCFNDHDNGETLVEKAKSFIQENYAKDLNRQFIARAIFVNADYLSRLFNKTVGVSIPEYIASVRIERSKQLLRSDIHVSIIASEVGIDNLSYFSKLFKKHTGMSPTEYKRRY